MLAINVLSEEAKAAASKIELLNDKDAFETLKEIHLKKGHIINELIANESKLSKKVRDQLEIHLRDRT